MEFQEMVSQYMLRKHNPTRVRVAKVRPATAVPRTRLLCHLLCFTGVLALASRSVRLRCGPQLRYRGRGTAVCIIFCATLSIVADLSFQGTSSDLQH